MSLASMASGQTCQPTDSCYFCYKDAAYMSKCPHCLEYTMICLDCACQLHCPRCHSPICASNLALNSDFESQTEEDFQTVFNCSPNAQELWKVTVECPLASERSQMRLLDNDLAMFSKKFGVESCFYDRLLCSVVLYFRELQFTSALAELKNLISYYANTCPIILDDPCLVAWLRLDENGEAGLYLEWSYEGYIVTEIEMYPGQLDLRVNDLLVAIAGQSLRGFPTEEAADDVMRAYFEHGVEITIRRAHDSTSIGGSHGEWGQSVPVVAPLPYSASPSSVFATSSGMIPDGVSASELAWGKQNKIPHFWKIDLADDSCELLRSCVASLTLSHSLAEVPSMYVPVLSFGVKRNTQAATEDFYKINSILQRLQGQTLHLKADRMIIHPDVVFVNVMLPPELLRPSEKYYILILAAVGVDSVNATARRLLDTLDSQSSSQELCPHLCLQGEVSLPTHRAKRVPEEKHGEWVIVKKHSGLSTAVVFFQSESVCKAILTRYAQSPLKICGIDVQIKPHRERQANHPVPGALFASWPKRTLGIRASDLQEYFDAAVITSGTSDYFDANVARQQDAHVAVNLLRNKVNLPSPQNAADNDIVLLKLTRYHSRPEVINALLTSDLLSDCHARMKEAQQDISPDWANGAKILVPFVLERVIEAGLELKPYNIIAMGKDIQAIRETLATIPNRQRPQLKEDRVVCLASGCESDDEENDCPMNVVLVCNLPSDSSLTPSS